MMVPGTGIEPVWEIALPTDFKSVASTYFATRAMGASTTTPCGAD